MPEYRPIEGYPGYRVGSDGSVWSAWIQRHWRHGGRIVGQEWKRMRPTPQTAGYPQIWLCADGERKHFLVSRLILGAFVGTCPEGMEACHFPDPTPSNCALANLRWDTKSGNSADRKVHGTTCEGERSGRAKLTEERVRLAFALRSQGVRSAAIAEQIGVSPGNVRNILAGRAWSHLGLAATPRTATA